MGEYRLVIICADLPVPLIIGRARPQPTIAGLVNMRPKAFGKRHAVLPALEGISANDATGEGDTLTQTSGYDGERNATDRTGTYGRISWHHYLRNGVEPGVCRVPPGICFCWLYYTMHH